MDWSVNDVQRWLLDNNLGECQVTFMRNAIDGKALFGLTKSDLKSELDIPLLSTRKRLWNSLEELRQADEKGKMVAEPAPLSSVESLLLQLKSAAQLMNEERTYPHEEFGYPSSHRSSSITSAGQIVVENGGDHKRPDGARPAPGTSYPSGPPDFRDPADQPQPSSQAILGGTDGFPRLDSKTQHQLLLQKQRQEFERIFKCAASGCQTSEDPKSSEGSSNSAISSILARHSQTIPEDSTRRTPPRKSSNSSGYGYGGGGAIGPVGSEPLRRGSAPSNAAATAVRMPPHHLVPMGSSGSSSQDVALREASVSTLASSCSSSTGLSNSSGTTSSATPDASSGLAQATAFPASNPWARPQDPARGRSSSLAVLSSQLADDESLARRNLFIQHMDQWADLIALHQAQMASLMTRQRLEQRLWAEAVRNLMECELNVRNGLRSTEWVEWTLRGSDHCIELEQVHRHELAQKEWTEFYDLLERFKGQLSHLVELLMAQTEKNCRNNQSGAEQSKDLKLDNQIPQTGECATPSPDEACTYRSDSPMPEVTSPLLKHALQQLEAAKAAVTGIRDAWESTALSALRSSETGEVIAEVDRARKVYDELLLQQMLRIDSLESYGTR